MTCEIKTLVNEQVNAALWDCCPSFFIERITDGEVFQTLQNIISEDVIAFSKKDPASKRNPAEIISGYTSFQAILHYRIASFISKLGHLQQP